MPWVGGPDGGGLLVYLQGRSARPLGTPPGKVTTPPVGHPSKGRTTPPVGHPSRGGELRYCQVVLEVDGSSHAQSTAATVPRLLALTAF